MNKTTKIIIAVSASTLITLLITGIAAGLLWQHFWNNAITVDQATAVALKDAGFTENQVSGLRGVREEEDGGAVYVIEFKREGVEYEYVIDAVKGTVLQIETDQSVLGEMATGGQITKAQAETIALHHAGLSKEDVTNLEIHIDSEVALPVFDVEFTHDNTEYEYEISAIDGSILTHSAEQK